MKSGQWWTYAGEPVTLKFMIRVDDPQGRLPAGRYIADQIEKAGIKVERLEYDRSKCINFPNGNPADLKWHAYTEAWGAARPGPGGQHRRPELRPLLRQHARRRRRRQVELREQGNRRARRTDQQQHVPHREGVLGQATQGHQARPPGVRAHLPHRRQRTLRREQGAVLGRIPYGLGDGLNDWSIRAADVVPEASAEQGLKVLRVTQFSAKGSLFMFAWDPVGDNGFSDSYAQAIMRPCTDTATFEAPNTALTVALRAAYDLKKTQTKVVAGKDGAPAGQVAVPENAVMFDTASKTWRKVKPGLTAFTAGTSGYLWGKWHHGADISFADMMYGTAFNYDWSFQDGEGDKYFDPSLGSIYAELLKLNKGFVVDAKNRTVTTYVDAHFPMEPARAQPIISPQAANPGYNAVVPREIYEALGQLVAEGSKSGTVYTFQFSDDAALTEVDVKDEKCVADIKAKLEGSWPSSSCPPASRTTQRSTRPSPATRPRSPSSTSTSTPTSPTALLHQQDRSGGQLRRVDAFRDHPYKSDYWPGPALHGPLLRGFREDPRDGRPQEGHRDRDPGFLLQLSAGREVASRQGQGHGVAPTSRRWREGLRGQDDQGRQPSS
ncbi:MAG: hypothetical protein M0C28_24415 [Candidatus Moduliflexus flocculans]|nr:hypothetical protein [Candidatus Moduliflexus flocculans]